MRPDFTLRSRTAVIATLYRQVDKFIPRQLKRKSAFYSASLVRPIQSILLSLEVFLRIVLSTATALYTSADKLLLTNRTSPPAVALADPIRIVKTRRLPFPTVGVSPVGFLEVSVLVLSCQLAKALTCNIGFRFQRCPFVFPRTIGSAPYLTFELRLCYNPRLSISEVI